ncbi:RNA polymerase sigma factor [Capnocytophaga sp. ARDL2]|uniref:RNA polymerase sigma factor n=1 Tax=Capnocytophaga sp. ARDL2 TaxID=3238809 RepID=UPI003558E215
MLFIETKDTNLFSYIYDRYAKFVYNKYIQTVRCKENSKDITHDIFIKIYINISKFRFESKISTWIYSVTYNACMDFLRGQQENVVNIDNEAIEEELDPGEQEKLEREIFALIYQRLLEVLELLTVTEKNIHLMKYQEDLSIKKILPY